MRGTVRTAALVTGLLAVQVNAGPAIAAMYATENGTPQGSPARVSLAAAVVGEGWMRIAWGDVGSIYGPFPFTSDEPVVVVVTDSNCPGDELLVHDGEVTLGRTSPSDTFSCGPDDTDDPDLAMADPRYSKGSWVLGAGRHSILFEAVQVPHDAGAGFFRVDPAPTPQTTTDCKGGGWRGLYAVDGTRFRNQGACVSSVAGGARR